jgi:hypothetical protein
MAEHVFGPAAQAPDWHVSGVVQLLPSLHAMPFAFAGFEHVPVAGLHVPASWHWSDAVHVTGLAPVQTPAWQLDVAVHASLSSQDAPFVFVGFEQTPFEGLHVPATWHWSDAVHTLGLPPVHVPA